VKSAIRTSIAFALFLLASPVQAQQPDSVSARYLQELDTRILNVGSGINRNEAGWLVQGYGHSIVTERTLPNYEPQWKTDLSFQINALKHLNNDLKLLVESQGQDFRDREASYLINRGDFQLTPAYVDLKESSYRAVTGQNSHIARGSLRAGVHWKETEAFQVEVLAGGAMDRQLEGSGEGFSGRAGFTLLDSENRGDRVEGYGSLDTYGDRSQGELRLTGSTNRNFGEAQNRLSASWSRLQHDLFLGGGGSIVSRVNDELNVANRLSTPFQPGIWGVYDLGYRRKSVDYQGGSLSQTRETDFTNRFAITGRRGPWNGNLAYGFNVEDRDYAGNLILGRRATLNANMGWGSSDEDSVRVGYSTQKLTFDSPDTLENSDRDRLVHRINALVIVPVGEDVRLMMSGLVSLDHLVYLKSERSGDNRWNRVFRLTPAVEWRCPRHGWRNMAAFEILANYTIYDFDDISTGEMRSNVLRRWSATDTLRVPWTTEWTSELSVRYDIEDRGRMLWEEFTQELSDETHALYLAGAVEKSIWTRVAFAVGYRFQRRIVDQYEAATDGSTILNRARTYEVYGPFLRFNTRGIGPVHFILNTSLMNVEDSEGYGPDRLDQIDLTLVYRW